MSEDRQHTSPLRRHAAIMFTDIVGYTALMGSDEDRAFEVLHKNRKIHTKFIEQFKGTLIKEMGDGMLLSFDLASDAVRCAIEIQKACKNQEIPLKIGIHEGEMVFEGNDVLGDGVNIASRIQDNTEPGDILISASVYQDIRNKSGFKAVKIGEWKFKNVAEPLRIYNIIYDEDTVTESKLKKYSSKLVKHKSFINQPAVKISSIFLGLAALFIFFLFYSGTALPFKERDWIIVSDFENITGEEVFDFSLNTAFALSINQSRYVNVFTRQRMKETLKRMKMGNVEKIDEEVAREIAIREGHKVFLSPSISKVGPQYVLTTKIQNAETGDILRSEVIYATAPDKILNSLDRLTKKTRRNLGESRYDIYSQSRPLSKVTTSSLDALKEFSLGIESHLNLDFAQAKVHYEKAIEIDSNFVAAKASLGNLLFERFDREEGRKWLEEVINQLDHLTKREQLGILAFYAVNIEGDLEKGIEITRSRIDLYPDDPIARNNLGWYYQNTGMYKNATSEYKAAIKIDPHLMLPYGGLIWIQLEKLGYLDSAFVWSRKMLQYDAQNPWAHFYLGSAYVGFNQLEDAVENFKRSIELNPNLLLSKYRLAHTYRLQRQFEEAIEVLQNIQDTNPNEIPVYYDLAINFRYAGNEAQAQQLFQEYLEKAEQWKTEFPDYPTTYTSIGVGYTQIGDKQTGWEFGKKAIELDSTFHYDYSIFLSVQEKKDEALYHFEKALENGYRDIVWIKLNSGFDPIRNEPKFIQLIDSYFKL